MCFFYYGSTLGDWGTAFGLLGLLVDLVFGFWDSWGTTGAFSLTAGLFT